MKLNSRQTEAIKNVSGPCLVLAGAGSGKTGVITKKIEYLVQHCGYNPNEIAALTFTNKAAKEMKERVDSLLGKKRNRGAYIATFHRLGLDIIKKEYKSLGLTSNFSLFDDQDQIALIKELLSSEANTTEIDKDYVKNLITFISNIKNLEIQKNSQKLSHYYLDDSYPIYKAYVKQLKSYNAIDFDDLISYPLTLFKEYPEKLIKWQKKIKYLLVDEYQDTNSSQYEFVKLLVKGRNKFTVVGDDDQSIYSWRGAQPENLVLLTKDFPELEVIKLEKNYRSTNKILTVANSLIANNSHVFEKKLFSEIPGTDLVKIMEASDEQDEAKKIVQAIITHQFLNQKRFDNYAILYRGNHQSRLFEKYLTQHNIPYNVSGGTSFFSRAEVKDIMAYLKLIVNPNDDNSFLRVANVPKRDIGAKTLSALGDYAKIRNKTLLEASCELGLEHHLPARSIKALRLFTKWLMASQEEYLKGNTEKLLSNIVSQIGYDVWLLDNSSSQKVAEYKQNNINELIGWVISDLKGDNYQQEPIQLKEIIQKFTLRDMFERAEDDDASNEVQLMTLHASKGLEFPHVSLVGFEEGILPHQNSINDDNVEEERRLAYVGITRAKTELTISYCKERSQFGEKVLIEPSRFLFELPKEELDWLNIKKDVTPEQRMHKGKTHIANLKKMLKK
ncbi:ATP-dependent DNA helicase Rep [Paraphotobacterium marinum]|uniref:ATP-dependent DNA helicase Rep n=1 Tax=Paraphotobacterium marinum TaxID=1755811 RepID=A0A220VCL1_9GAMM|nr:UvrD-helicase domain-containing protein [Paraphotobacterium marinum]ASK78087.1 ATP-dependent DNA helicase Rep [Paraphotobacterium marinum]